MRKDQLIVPIDGVKLMKSRLDLVSINGRSPVIAIKKRKAREVFTGVMPTENTPMLKLAYQFSKEVSHNSLSNFSCVFT